MKPDREQALDRVGRPRILVVDDLSMNVVILSEMLKNDYEVLAAKSGRRALEVCESQQPDLVLLDVMMPEIDGLRTCQLLKENESTREIPVIFVTGCDSTEDETKGLQVGAVDFISKPVNPAVLKARVRTHLALRRQTQMLKELVFVDVLTGLPNRRRFEQQLDADFRACERAGVPLSLVALDIDHFKAYNDSYGHQAGDDVLRELAFVLSQALVRPRDLIVRYGGQRFVCLLPDMEEPEAMRTAEHMLRRVDQAALHHAAPPARGHVTVSAGLVTVVPDKKLRLRRLMTRVDERLREAKAAGRARVAGSPDLARRRSAPPLRDR